MSFGINGQTYQHALIDLQAVTTSAPFQFTRFKSIKYKDGTEKKAVMDHQGQVVNFTVGEQKMEGSFSMLLSEWFDFRTFLRSQAVALSAQFLRPVGIGQVMFVLTVQYGMTLATLQKDEVTCMLNEDGRDSSDNQEALLMECPLFVFRIKDGKTGDTFMKYA